MLKFSHEVFKIPSTCECLSYFACQVQIELYGWPQIKARRPRVSTLACFNPSTNSGCNPNCAAWQSKAAALSVRFVVAMVATVYVWASTMSLSSATNCM